MFRVASLSLLRKHSSLVAASTEALRHGPCATSAQTLACSRVVRSRQYAHDAAHMHRVVIVAQREYLTSDSQSDSEEVRARVAVE